MPPWNRFPITRSYPFPQFADERIELREIVTVIRVAHQDKSPARGCDSSAQRASVTARLDGNDSRAKLRCDFPRTIRAAIVGDDHFTANSMPLHRLQRFLDADANRRPLVQAWHHDGEFDVVPAFWSSLGDLRFRCQFYRRDPEPSRHGTSVTASTLTHRAQREKADGLKYKPCLRIQLGRASHFIPRHARAGLHPVRPARHRGCENNRAGGGG